MKCGESVRVRRRRGGPGERLVELDKQLELLRTGIEGVTERQSENDEMIGLRVRCGRRPRCKRNLVLSLRSGASHVSGLVARRMTAGPDVVR